MSFSLVSVHDGSHVMKEDVKTPSTDSGLECDAVSVPVSDFENIVRNGCTGSIESFSSISEGIVTDSLLISMDPICTPSKRNVDELLPADKLWTADGTEAVKLRLEASGPLSEKPITVMTALRQTVEKAPNHPAIAAKRDGKWVKWTYQEYYNLIRLAAKGFMALGLERFRSVGILGFNSPEWFISDLATIFAGGFSCGIYSTNTAEACQFVAENAKCNIIVVENDTQLQKILKVRDQISSLKAIVQYKGEPSSKYQDVYSWEELLEKGKLYSDEALEERSSQMAPNLCCTLIYTSGTTGNPKGVMLSHDNLIWTARMAGVQGNVKFQYEEVVSYLPLSHVAAQVLDIFIPILYAGTVYFAQPDALRGSLGNTLKEVRPTSFLGVPRVWEKMQEKMQGIGKTQSYFKKKVAKWAKGVGLQGNLALSSGKTHSRRRNPLPYGWSLANALVFTKVRAALGFDRCSMCFTAAAPIMKDTLDFFMSLNIPLLEIYGMSESSGPHTISLPWKYRTTSVGVDIDGCSTKLAKQDQDGNGEVCLSGRNTFMGYLNEEEKTREVFDEDGFLHSGDVGKKDDDGFIYITGRIKELLITAGGENVAPVPIEDAVKEQLPCISNCMLVGDRRKFLSILLTFKVEVDPVTSEPLDKLSSTATAWCRSVGSNATTVTEIIKTTQKPLMKAIQEAIDRANSKAISRAQIIQKWTVLQKDFSIPGGELGPTLKLKRPLVAKMYANTIDSFYANSGTD